MKLSCGCSRKPLKASSVGFGYVSNAGSIVHVFEMSRQMLSKYTTVMASIEVGLAKTMRPFISEFEIEN